MNLPFAFHALFLSLCFFSCAENTPKPSPLDSMQEIKGRDYTGSRFDVYRARVPIDWIRKDPLPEESLTDTTKSLCEFLILTPNGTIRIAIHNFPSDHIEQRIPQAAQIARWQRQLEVLIPSQSGTVPQAFSGYSGLKFKGVGLLDSKDSIVLGWSLQLGQDHYKRLLNPPDPSKTALYREMRADITIKAVGPKQPMEVHEEEIDHFARSFELIEEIPSSP